MYGPWREVGRSTPSSAEVRNEWNYTSTLYAFKARTGIKGRLFRLISVPEEKSDCYLSKKVNQSHYRAGGFQEVKAPRLRDNTTGWW